MSNQEMAEQPREVALPPDKWGSSWRPRRVGLFYGSQFMIARSEPGPDQGLVSGSRSWAGSVARGQVGLPAGRVMGKIVYPQDIDRLRNRQSMIDADHWQCREGIFVEGIERGFLPV